MIFGADRAGGVTESFGAPDGAGQVGAVSVRVPERRIMRSVDDPGRFGISSWWEAGGCSVVSVVCSVQGSRRGTWVVSFLFFDIYSQK